MDKCKVCGEVFEHYDHDKEDWVEGKRQVVIGGNFTVDKDYGQVSKVRLYACPECNSVFLGT
jgi:hypothetical protein